MLISTKKRELIFASLLFLTSCTISMPYYQQTENLILPPSIEASVESSLETPFFCMGDWPEENWWEVFNSLQLNDLIERALSQNPSIQQAQSRIQEAWQIAMVVRSKLFPFIFFKATDDWQHLSKNGLYRALNPTIPINANLIDIDLRLNYDFDLWGKNHQLFYAAIGREKAEEAESAQVKIVITTALAEAYFALKTNLIKRDYYKQLREVYSEIAQLQNFLKEKALLSALPHLFTEEQFLEADQLVLNSEKEIEINKHLINVLVGDSPDLCLDIDETLPSLPDCLSLPCNLSIDLLARRPDLMAQIWRVKALAYEVGAALADFFPDVNISAFIGLESTSYSSLLEASSLNTGIKPAIHLPIFTAGAIRANVEATKAAFDEELFEYNQLLLTSAQEVADLLALAKSIFYQKEDQEQILANAEKRYELTLLRKQSGLDSMFESYNIQKEVIEKQLENIDLLFWQYASIIQLIKALGGGYVSNYTIPIQMESCFQ